MLAECANYEQVLSGLRGEVIAILRAFPAALLNQRPLYDESHETNSLAVLSSHIAGAEYEWIGQVVGGLPQTRHRPDEFIATAVDAAPLITALEHSGATTREVLAGLTAAELDDNRERGDRQFNVRWCILHAIEHTALHLGHIQLTRQLLLADE
ncbi:MAG: DUF664 domain-containing protein [Anaerolineales bacterium]|nr:DUF664 domain-containing protein [Anaerolineales bacterium]MCB8959364.1 DUF664 domain-containing protein [Ardenticatenales bacterium]